MDKDTTTARGSSRTILKGLYHGNLDILIGTQMIVKGHHLPNVTLVGVVCADQSLNFPDFRASERTFQLLTQVAGRAGRGQIPGEVFIQTYNPNHYSIVCAQTHDYRRFYGKEMQYRQELGYPPWKKMINFRLEGASKAKTITHARDLEKLSKTLLSELKLLRDVDILGPASAPWGKIKGKYRYQMLLKSAKIISLRLVVSQILEHTQKSFTGSGVKLTVDVDPLVIL
jgi:primosomal protein N' (replication factor Y)